MDKQAIGTEILSFLTTRLDLSDEMEMITSLQNLCDEIMLPHEGFI
jgi:hypothetical protein